MCMCVLVCMCVYVSVWSSSCSVCLRVPEFIGSVKPSTSPRLSYVSSCAGLCISDIDKFSPNLIPDPLYLLYCGGVGAWFSNAYPAIIIIVLIILISHHRHCYGEFFRRQEDAIEHQWGSIHEKVSVRSRINTINNRGKPFFYIYIFFFLDFSVTFNYYDGNLLVSLLLSICCLNEGISAHDCKMIPDTTNGHNNQPNQTILPINQYWTSILPSSTLPIIPLRTLPTSGLIF